MDRNTVHHLQAFKPNSKVAGYTVLKELGRGAASIIYLVQDAKTKQIWALKHVAKQSPKDQRFLDQTETEYAIGSQIKDSRVRRCVRLIKNRKLLTVREMYLIMEYVDGVSVERARPTDLRSALQISSQVAAGLAAMHDLGYVHADMKPNNVVVLDDGKVKIIDLGQSCAVGAVKPRIQGTPDYIAPEQVHRQPITPQTDVYNLGATMYWVLTGNNIPTALPKDDRLVGSLDAGFIELPPPPSEINPDVPNRLDYLVMRCVEPEVERRPVDMHAVVDSLASIVAELEAQDDAAADDIDDDEDGGGAPTPSISPETSSKPTVTDAKADEA